MWAQLFKLEINHASTQTGACLVAFITIKGAIPEYTKRGNLKLLVVVKTHPKLS